MIRIVIIIIFCLSISPPVYSVVWPISGDSNPNSDVMTSAFGPRYKSGQPNNYYFHQGLDIRALTPQDVYSTSPAGLVTYRSDNENQPEGRWLRILHHDSDNDPEYYYTQYLHLSEIYIDEYGFVGEGTLIARSGNTGYPPPVDYHLHYDYRPSNEHGVIFHRQNPLHILPYGGSFEPTIEYPPSIYYGSGGRLTSVEWVVNYYYYDLDFNRIDFHYWASWHSMRYWDFNHIDYDERHFVDYYFNLEQARVDCYPFDFITPGSKRIKYVLTLTDDDLDIYAPVDEYVGVVVNDIGWPSCNDCFGDWLPDDCWWGNPQCHSPVISISYFRAELVDQTVLLSWMLHTSLSISGINILKSEDINKAFKIITKNPIPASTNNGQFMFIDAQIEDGHQYYYKLQLVLEDSTKITLEMIASTEFISFLPNKTSINSVYPNPFHQKKPADFSIDSRYITHQSMVAG